MLLSKIKTFRQTSALMLTLPDWLQGLNSRLTSSSRMSFEETVQHWTQTIVSLLSVTLVILLLVSSPAYAYIVPPLPPGNLVQNPWFEDLSNPLCFGDSGGPKWGTGEGWQFNHLEDMLFPSKFTQPSDQCEGGPALKFGPKDTTLKIGVDYYAWQDIPADSTARKLTFSFYYVEIRTAISEVDIFGLSNGQWIPVWHVWDNSQTVFNPGFFTFYEATTELPQGYPMYRIQFHMRLDDLNPGFKVTGIHFRTEEGITPPSPDPGCDHSLSEQLQIIIDALNACCSTRNATDIQALEALEMDLVALEASLCF